MAGRPRKNFIQYVSELPDNKVYMGNGSYWLVKEAVRVNMCENCGEYFVTKRRDKRTCGDACRKALSRR